MSGRRRKHAARHAPVGPTVPAVVARDRHGRRMGEVLVEQGLLTPSQLDQRLAAHREEGAPLGRVLMAHGDLTRRQLWDALAATWGIESIDLIAEPPDAALLAEVDPESLLAGGWVPVRRRGPTALLVATCERPDDDLAATVVAAFAAGGTVVTDVRFVATTDWDVEQAVLAGYSEEMVVRAAFELSEDRPELSAADPVVKWQKVAGLVLPAVVLVGALVDWRTTLLVVLVVLNAMFTIGVAFKLLTCGVGMVRNWRRARPDTFGAPDASQPPPPRSPHHRGDDLPDADLPVYTILVPAFREANVVEEVVSHISALDYPLSKLQVLLLLEADDTETIAAAKAARPPDYVRLVVVPPGGPQTKPKACNVGLQLAEGEFLVIYDAEDRPQPEQLREAVAAFRAAGDDTVCFQARLNYFNTDQNILTRMFTLEYSFWFDDMLPGLDALHLPIPLGGTSNHFRVQALRDLGGWDPFNVTEDADLGVRAAALGLHVGITDSTTWEEACSEWTAWIRQRTRWIKGYMVTALVHLRRPVESARRLGWRGMVGLIGLIAGTPMLFLAAPVVWAFFLYTFLGGVVPQFALPEWAKLFTLFNLLIGNLAMIAMTALAAGRRRNWGLAGYALLNPFYWVLHSIAAWRALYQLVLHPAHWEKTPHGIVHGPEAMAAARAEAEATARTAV